MHFSEAGDNYSNNTRRNATMPYDLLEAHFFDVSCMSIWISIAYL